jgi:hypothetical protein
MFLTLSSRRFNFHLKIGKSFLGIRMSFHQSSLQIFAMAFQFITLGLEAPVAHHQQIVIFDTMIHSALQRILILFKLRNTPMEWHPAILSNDSFSIPGQF